MNKYRVIKNYDAVARMKRVVKGRRWWNDWANNIYYQSKFMRPIRMVINNKY